ncbi:hypothetical protein Goari_021446 [Gossypium aridum]|uniref:Uncharacterized protein n=1 Tax=Gossypium aridum TaxID=34290 RepID=A0A7J8YED3_GOSAI|nr:hypothetical protein [Gossypium aridum]
MSGCNKLGLSTGVAITYFVKVDWALASRFLDQFLNKPFIERGLAKIQDVFEIILAWFATMEALKERGFITQASLLVGSSNYAY